MTSHSCCHSALQIFVQVAFFGARPGMDPATPEPLRRLIRKCWDKVAPQLFFPASFSTVWLPGKRRRASWVPVPLQEPQARPSSLDVMRLTSILLAKARRDSAEASSSSGPASGDSTAAANAAAES